jgi:hypothetical protein
MAALLMCGLGTLVVGVEEDPQGVRVFVDHRSRGLYFIARGETAEMARRAWAAIGNHLVLDVREMPPLITHYDTVAASLALPRSTGGNE